MEDLIFYRYLTYHKNNVKKWPIQSCKKYIHLKWNCYFLQGSLLSWSYGSWIYNSLINQCLPPLKLWVRSPFMARCTRYNIMWWSLSLLATSNISQKQDGCFLRVLRFLPPIKLTPRYNWNIVESGMALYIRNETKYIFFLH